MTKTSPVMKQASTGQGEARHVTYQEYAHERLVDSFGETLSRYDTERRLDILIDEFLPDAAVRGRRALDVGCGLGFFSERLAARGALVTACDLGPQLVERTRQRVGCTGVVCDALRLAEQFGPQSFDLVVSSECIEHTPNPTLAIQQMVTLLRPGGYLSLSTPNVVWEPVVRLATACGMRPYDGLENFSSWVSLRRAIVASGASVVRERGLHLFPFQLPLHRVSRWCDTHLQALRGGMINLCVLARKDAP